MRKIQVQDTEIRIAKKVQGEDYVCLTDIARQGGREPSEIIKNFVRTRTNIEFLGVWEELHNPDFNLVLFDQIRSEAGLPTFTMSVKSWTKQTGAIGIESKAGRYGGTYAHPDIALGFCYWMNPKFQVYFLKEFQRLKQEETQELQWTVRRELSKINYRLHTDAVKLLLPPKIDKQGQRFIYANEADLLNLALFGTTAKQWRIQHTDKVGNIRDHASIEQLTVLVNLEHLNAYLIESGFEPDERLVQLNKEAIKQMDLLLKYDTAKHLRAMDTKKVSNISGQKSES